MAKSNAVWGIDIGQCALKALRCRPHEKDDHRIVVEAFDYIEYPKILTQPEANRDELIKEALEEFVSRNDVSGDEVAISVSGQSGLARFIKLPPVERKKIPDIVKYEARQQIPFALEDVVWDYQPLVGSEDEGYALETEVGLFAMKRDQVAKALKPLEEAAIDVDIIQLAPLAIYNFISFDRLKVEGPYDPANPPQSTVVISLGTDTTDLVITNGYRVWQRSIPIGGNHFTKALTKELKLTFAKAEHLKRNAMKAENPKAVFQAMRPVFSDLVAEIQRSIGFFTSNNRNAKLGEMVALGNPMKLPGLQRFLSQNLDQEIKLVDSFNSLVGGSNTASPQFKENQLTFGVSYGLCLQALDKAQLKTNLLPEEIVTTRLVRAKKPWAVIAVALLLLGMTINYLSHYSAWKTAALGASNPAMDRAIQAAKNVQDENTKFTSENTTLTASFDTITTTGENLQSNVDGRLLWLEVLKAIDAALPKDSRPVDQRKETAADVMLRPELHITSVDCEYFPALAPWYSGVERFYDSAVAYRKAKEAGQKPPAAQPTPAPGDAAAAGTTPPAEDATATPTTSAAEAGTTTAAEAAAPPAEAPATSEPPAVDPNAAATATGEALADGSAPAADDWRAKPGWVIQLDGYHFHNGDPDNEGAQFIIDTFFKDLEEGKVSLPDGPDGKPIEVPIAELGIHHPVLITQYKIWDATYLPQAVDDQAAAGGVLGMGARPSYSRDEEGGGQLPGEQAPEMWKLRRYDFRIQFAWQPQPRGKRLEKMAGQKTESTRTAATEPASTDGNR